MKNYKNANFDSKDLTYGSREQVNKIISVRLETMLNEMKVKDIDKFISEHNLKIKKKYYLSKQKLI